MTAPGLTTVRAMAKRRNEVEMTADETAAFLDEQRILNVASIGPTGHPHLVAMWFVMIDGRPTFWTFGKSQKAVNLRRDPRISALVEAGDSYNELRGVELEGTAELIEDYDRVLEIGKRVGAKYNGPEATSELALSFLEKQAHKRIGIAIDVARIRQLGPPQDRRLLTRVFRVAVRFVAGRATTILTAAANTRVSGR